MLSGFVMKDRDATVGSRGVIEVPSHHRCCIANTTFGNMVNVDERAMWTYENVRYLYPGIAF